MEAHIREAKMSDYDSINDLFRQGEPHQRLYPDIFTPQAEPPRPIGWLIEQLEDDNNFLIVAEQQSVIVGMLRGTVIDQDHPWLVAKSIGVIESVLVAETFRNQGIGTGSVGTQHSPQNPANLNT